MNISKIMTKRIGSLGWLLLLLFSPSWVFAGEADLVVPDLGSVKFMNIDGRSLLLSGLLICVLGFAFGLIQFFQIKKMQVHHSMQEVSELIYETCKTYLVAQGKFLLLLEVLVGGIIFLYFWWLRHFDLGRVGIILICSLIGIGGSYLLAWFGIRINTMANSR